MTVGAQEVTVCTVVVYKVLVLYPMMLLVLGTPAPELVEAPEEGALEAPAAGLVDPEEPEEAGALEAPAAGLVEALEGEPELLGPVETAEEAGALERRRLTRSWLEQSRWQ